jgi:GTP-binding protein HflX
VRLFERPASGERAVLVHLDIAGESEREDLQEFIDLVRSAGAEPIATILGRRAVPDAGLYVGRGKAEEIRDSVRENDAEVVIFDHALGPNQERNLEKLLSCRVLARTGLILDIFAQRARSFEGKLQVELAQLQHMSTRLVRGWSHLERQKGGIGLRGPGETQLETDRRLIGVRIRQINRRLAKVHQQRSQGRRARARADVPTVSLVGYTNAGKSSLFNVLTGAHAYAADQLFATLDPTLRRMELGGIGPVVMADTVGFIRHLPHDLVAAFRSTLEETRQAHLLLHVIDAQADDRQMRIGQVNAVLREIGADEVPQIRVYNKIDLAGQSPRLVRDRTGRVEQVWVSAATGEGLDLLRTAVQEFFQDTVIQGWVRVPPHAGRLRARLYGLGTVISEQVDAEGCWWIETRMAVSNLDTLCRKEGMRCDFLPSGPSARLAEVAGAS